MYYRTFWYGKKHFRTKKLFKKPLPTPENQFGKIPLAYRYSTRNLSFHSPTSRRIQDQYPCLFDYQEVNFGFYIYPRVVFNEEKQIYETLPEKYWGAPLNVGIRSGTYPLEFITDIYTPYYHVKLPKGANIKKWLYYDENQCNTTGIVGSMGSGKSTLLNDLANLCLAREAVVMAIDVFCEARHLSNVGTLKKIDDLEFPIENLPQAKHPITKVVIMTKLEIWFHENAKVDFVNKDLINRPNISIHRFTNTNEIIDSIAIGKVIAIFDESFTRKSINLLWFEIAYKLNRRREVDFTIDLFHHEQSKLLPSHPSKKQFDQVEDFADEYTNFRKAEVRYVGGQQLKAETFWRTGQKETYTMYKAGSRLDNIRGARKRFLIQQLALDETLVEFRGAYSLHSTPKFPEAEGKFRIIKLNDVDYGEKEKEEIDEEENKNLPISLELQEKELRKEWILLNRKEKPSDIPKTKFIANLMIEFIMNHPEARRLMIKRVINKPTNTFNKYWNIAMDRLAESELSIIEGEQIEV